VLICAIAFGLGGYEARVNLDSHHNGVMYAQALGMAQGLTPHKDIFIMYGVLTSWLQSLSVRLLGERFVAIGIITSLFHALNLGLSYRILSQILSRPIAFIGTVILFLLHGYAIYAWSNYFSYTFLLVAMLLLLRYTARFALLSGVAVGLSILCRYSAAPAILLSFISFLLYDLIIIRQQGRKTVLILVSFITGVALPTVTFGLFLWQQDAIGAYICQNRSMLQSSNYGTTLTTVIPKLLTSVFSWDSISRRDSRLNFFTLLFASLVIATIYLLSQHRRTLSPGKAQRLRHLALITSVSLGGYINALHIYEEFRLVNASAIGIGVMLYWVEAIAQSRWSRRWVAGALCSISFIWANSLVGVHTSAVYYPWSYDSSAVMVNDIQLLRGKIVAPDYYNFYRQVDQVLAKLPAGMVIVNETFDAALPSFRPIASVQSLPMTMQNLNPCTPDRAAKVAQAEATQRAIFFRASFTRDNATFKPPQGYRTVLQQPWPTNIPWLGGQTENLLSGRNPKLVPMELSLNVMIPESMIPESMVPKSIAN
jgi:Dolichyl-phosphate-mannose-protein mannosyltransferase